MKKEVVDLLVYEKELYKEGYHLICGTDEAGRGPLVGPVVAAAVILPENFELEGTPIILQFKNRNGEE